MMIMSVVLSKVVPPLTCSPLLLRADDAFRLLRCLGRVTSATEPLRLSLMEWLPVT